jgi:hypothetical protein
MEQALSNCSSEDKQKISGAAIFHAISSPDPVRSMKESLDAIRKGAVPRMINCVALSLGATQAAAEDILCQYGCLAQSPVAEDMFLGIQLGCVRIQTFPSKLKVKPPSRLIR